MQNPDLKLPQNLMVGRAWIETITLFKKNPKKQKNQTKQNQHKKKASKPTTPW